MTLDDHIAALPPGYFALVMATGIVSIASHLLGFDAIAWALLVINVAAYVALWAMTVWRIARHFDRLAADMADHGRGPGFFTNVAATCVLGSQWLLITGQDGVAWVLWWFGLGLWAFIIYAFFAAVTLTHKKPPLSQGIDGTWMLAIVATQSVAILGALLVPEHAVGYHLQLFVCLSLFLFGCLLYVPIVTMILYRFTFLPLHTEGLTPPYWINMGAMAITTLAGASLVLKSQAWSFLVTTRPFLQGVILLFWAFATWWIPLLVILGVWRHVYKRYPLTYNAQYWGMVFPLGMYTACTWKLADALELPALKHISHGFIFVALLAWLLTSVGLALRLVRFALDRQAQSA